MGEKSGEEMGEGLEAGGCEADLIKSALYTCMKFSTQQNKKTLIEGATSVSYLTPHLSPGLVSSHVYSKLRKTGSWFES